MAEQKLPIGIQSFEQLRTEKCLYVDKTKDVYHLATEGVAYFLSRPRRFGKSMLCSTFKALFEGKKHLFEGTWITGSDWQWQEHPVIHLDLSKLAYKNPDELARQIELMVGEIAVQHGVKLNPKTSSGNALGQLIEALSKPGKPQPVVLIDEYDKPIINSLNNLEQLEQYRDMLYNCYGPLKALGEKMRFLFITGVSQFAKVSIFSALNHLENVSCDAATATICGYTQAELEYSFDEHITKATAKFKLTREQMLAEIKHWYNGYSFAKPEDAPERVYNPFSVLNFFKKLSFENYWFTSGTPTFVIDYFKTHAFCMADFEKVIAGASELGALEPSKLNLITLLYQSGYLTIKKYDAENAAYELGFPNHEVAKSCMDGLLTYVLKIKPTTMQSFGTELRKLFTEGRCTYEAFVDILARICSQIPCWISPEVERGYQLVFWMVLEMSGLEVFIEDATALGRIDATIIVGEQAFVMEMKIKGTAQEALEQIVTKRYGEKYRARGLSVSSIGVVFDTNKRTVKECVIVDAKGKKTGAAKKKSVKKVAKKVVAKKPAKKSTTKKVAKKSTTGAKKAMKHKLYK